MTKAEIREKAHTLATGHQNTLEAALTQVHNEAIKAAAGALFDPYIAHSRGYLRQAYTSAILRLRIEGEEKGEG